MYKYSCLFLLLCLSAVLKAQPGGGPQAIVTIIGDPVQSQGNFINNDENPYNDNNNAPPPQGQMAELSNKGNIDPSLDNGFHVRFELESPAISERPSGYMSSSSGISGKTKKHTPTMAERSFNVKKKIKSVLPKRKKKYRPHLCGRF